MKTFKEYIDAKDMPDNLDESSLSRIMTHVEKTQRFGVISAYRKENSTEKNLADQKELVKKVRKLGYGYISLNGGYQEEKGFVSEPSLFIPIIKRKEIVELGKHYFQHSIIHKDKDDFVMIGTNKKAGIGEVLSRYKIDGRNISVDDVGDKFTEFFSQLTKGSHKGKKFIFVEKLETGSMFNKDKNLWEDIFTCERIDVKE